MRGFFSNVIEITASLIQRAIQSSEVTRATAGESYDSGPISGVALGPGEIMAAADSDVGASLGQHLVTSGYCIFTDTTPMLDALLVAARNPFIG